MVMKPLRLRPPEDVVLVMTSKDKYWEAKWHIVGREEYDKNKKCVFQLCDFASRIGVVRKTKVGVKLINEMSHNFKLSTFMLDRHGTEIDFPICKHCLKRYTH